MLEFDENTIVKVWERARAVAEYDPMEWREDECGAWIRRSQYGLPGDEFGWKIEYTRPGLEDPRPFHVHNDFDVSTGRPHCRVTADRRSTASTAQLGQPRNRALTGQD